MPIRAGHHGGVHRAAWTLAVLLALPTGAAVTETAALLTAPVTARADAGAISATVASFYRAINTVLATGDPAALDQIVAPAFVGRGDEPNGSQDLAALKQRLIDLHRIAPGAELIIDEIAVAGDEAIVRVSVSGAATVRFAGLSLADPSLVWSPFDLLRVANRRVVERWSGEADTPRVSALGDASLGARLPATGIIALDRITVAPGASLPSPITGVRVVIAETAGLTLTVDPGSLATVTVSRPTSANSIVVTPGAAAPLAAGDIVPLTSAAKAAVANAGEQPASALVLTVRSSSNNSASPVHVTDRAAVDVPWADGVTARSIVAATHVALPAGPARVAVGQVAIPAGAQLPLITAPGPVVVVAESGAFEIASIGATPWLRQDAAGLFSNQFLASLRAGERGLLPMGTAAHFAATGDEPTVVLLLTISLDASGAIDERR